MTKTQRNRPDGTARRTAVAPVTYPAPMRIAGWCVVVLTGHVFLTYADRGLSVALQAAPDGLVAPFRLFGELGDSKWYLVPTGVVAVVLHLLRAGPIRRTLLAGISRRVRAVLGWAANAALFVFVAVALSGILANVLKLAVGRARPKLLAQEGFLGGAPLTLDSVFRSFPSGHANTAVAFALAVGFLAPGLRVPLLIAAAVVSFSRVMVNAHFLTDIVAGAALAVVTSYWLREMFARRGLLFCGLADRGYRPAWPGRLLPYLIARLAEKRRENWRRRAPSDGGVSAGKA